MLRSIRWLIAPPVFEGDAEKTRAAWLLNIILLTLLARAFLIQIVTGPEPPRPSFVVPFSALLVVMMFVMRRGAVRLASALTVTGFWLSLSVAAVVTGGLHSTGFRNYILPVIVAGLLLGQGAAIITAAASILAGLVMWVAQMNGLIESSPEPGSMLELFITHSISLLMAAVLVTLGTRSIEAALERAKQEIAERTHAEQAVRASEERFSKTFNLSPLRMGIVRIRDAEVLDVNECWLRDMGFNREDIVGHSILDLTAWVGAEAPRIRQLLEEGKPVRNFEGVATTKGGEKRDTLVSAEVMDISGEPCMVWVCNDITERKRAEEQIKATSEQLRALMISLRSAREQEGVRIAREIHDELGSALTSLRWDLEATDKAVSETEDLALRSALHGKIRAMSGLVDDTIDVVRRISSTLRTSILDDLGLAAAVEWEAQQFQARTGIICRYDCSADNVDLDPEQSTAVFRIFQEALTNVLRHAHATQTDVSLEETENEFVLKIRDDGRGIRESERTGPASLGLLGMRERADLIGGKIEITGVEGKGTSVILRVPLLRRHDATATA